MKHTNGITHGLQSRVTRKHRGFFISEIPFPAETEGLSIASPRESCSATDLPEGVLIRGVVGATGPGRATKAMQIDKSFYGESLLTKDRIWVEDDGKNYDFVADKRVGIGYASQEDQDRLWRFILKE